MGEQQIKWALFVGFVITLPVLFHAVFVAGLIPPVVFLPLFVELLSEFNPPVFGSLLITGLILAELAASTFLYYWLARK